MNHKIFYMQKPIASMASLCDLLEVNEERLRLIAENITDFYLLFEQTRRNKTRLLADPKTELKRIQRRIVARIFSHIKFPHYLHGGIKTDDKRDFVSNARAHVGSHVAIALDITNFFPSIKQDLVYKVFLHLFHFSEEVAEILTKLTTLNGGVPQGAPTSTYISNLVMFDQEFKAVRAIERQGFIYTRLVDDITISSKIQISPAKITKAIDSIYSLLKIYSFVSNPSKHKIYTRKNPKELMTITGLWINRGAPRLLASKRDAISYDVNKLRIRADREITVSDYREAHDRASGQVALLQRLDHVEAHKLRATLQSILPLYDEEDRKKIIRDVNNFCRASLNRSSSGYIRKFYKLQHRIHIVGRNDPGVAGHLQKKLKKVMPTATLRNINE